jgi:hypothetical protein
MSSRALNFVRRMADNHCQAERAASAPNKEKYMSHLLKVAAAAAALLAVSHVSSHAQATRTWVSGVGDDVNPCSRTAPCKTFPGAISKTARNGIINCLDNGSFGAVTITKSITIDCHEVYAGLLAAGTNGIIVNITDPADTLKTVRLRNINIDGSGNGARTGLKGIRIIAANAVFIDDCQVQNMTQEGIRDERIAGGALFITNTASRDNAGAGISITPSSGTVRIDATLSGVVAERNSDGIRVGNAARVMVKRSVASGNTGSGIVVEGAAATGEVNIDETVMSNNGTGLNRLAGGRARLSNSDISFNATGKAGAGANTLTFGNNRVSGNGADGAALTPIAQE